MERVLMKGWLYLVGALIGLTLVAAGVGLENHSLAGFLGVEGIGILVITFATIICEDDNALNL
jgi:hypothetical protein